MSKLAAWCRLDDREATYAFGFALGQALLRYAHCPKLIAAYGDLGAGKTSLAQGLARGVGVPESVYVNSPTFAIHQAHASSLTHVSKSFRFHHLDLYRLGDEDELIQLGLEEFIESGISYVEWPTRAPEFFRQHRHLALQLFHLDEWEETPISELEEGRVIKLMAHQDDLTMIMSALQPQFELSLL